MENFRTIVRHLISNRAVIPGFPCQFQPGDGGRAVRFRDLNTAFLFALGDGDSSRQALEYLSEKVKDPDWRETAGFYLEALNRIEAEIRARVASDPVFKGNVRELADDMKGDAGMERPETLEKMRTVFFPEGERLPENKEEAVRELRKHRAVNIRSLNPDPIKYPHRQILFTANVLMTLPEKRGSSGPPPGTEIREDIERVFSEDQAFWYDHPIPLGVHLEKNEAVYGLCGLDEAVLFEINRGTAPPDARVPVLLSVSATHRGLQSVARPWLREELRKSGAVSHLDLYAVTEKDAVDMVDRVLIPAADRYLPERDTEPLREVFGVEGEYGRHYSFLKSAAAFWQVLIDEGVKATFKIDLDQIFPQESLVSETGRSAFEHLSDPLWGAEGTDAEGQTVRLGMLAGALVNESEIGKGLFTPDVKWPRERPKGDRWIFDSVLPQALSTEGEMMARYGGEGPDGRKACLQRVHVTGGTTGVLVEDLRAFRPFTPVWVGRAEDQAYLFSVLFPDGGPALRYVHAGGLFMRHDKEAFVSDAVKAAKVGKTVGDYVRIMVFSAYARALPWGVDKIKSSVDPFTGCFISKIPVTISTLRLALRGAVLFGKGAKEATKEAEDLLSMGCARLTKAAETAGNVDVVKKEYLRDKTGWNLYYDILDALEKELEEKDPFAEKTRERARVLIEGWRI